RVPNYADTRDNQVLTEGLVITVEPIIAAGSGKVFVAPDKWTMITEDHRASAHYEHTIVITKGAPMVLTAAQSAQVKSTLEGLGSRCVGASISFPVHWGRAAGGTRIRSDRMLPNSLRTS
ncbi:MAG TPA: hypothetical protein VNO32_29380, partial [Candidatus Acidoferrum sp.]|nr:hypothetical protein [Candidatus Acidoferrum sp.]